jgi:hypothetical protein
MKRLIVILSVLAVVILAAGCIFSNGSDDKEESSGVITDSLHGAWSSYIPNGTIYHRVEFGKFSSNWGAGTFSLYNYTVNKDGSHTQTWTGSGESWVELEKDGAAKDLIVLNFRVQGELINTVDYEFSLNGNKLTLGGTVYARE